MKTIKKIIELLEKVVHLETLKLFNKDEQEEIILNVITENNISTENLTTQELVHRVCAQINTATDDVGLQKILASAYIKGSKKA